MPEQILEKTKQQRSRVVRELAAENKKSYRQLFIDKEQTVLVEKINKDGKARGYGQHYVPVEFSVQQPGNNYFQTLTIKSTAGISQDYVLKGELSSSHEINP
jgi:threonylcarbamoyladenosine tRNA methylthiotransferase MtaB